MMGGCVPDMHVWPPIRMDWRKMTKTRDSILRMNQTIVYVGFNAGKNIILILRAESPIMVLCNGPTGPTKVFSAPTTYEK